MGDREIALLAAWVFAIILGFIIYYVVYSERKKRIAIKKGLAEGIIALIKEDGKFIDMYVSKLGDTKFSGKNIHNGEHMDLYYYQFIKSIK